ncbi:MAG: ribosome silencing factor [Candidatus Omnitrophota bacterium]
METKDLAQAIAKAAKSKKAQKVVILDMRKVASFCDYFVIASGTSLRQVNAIAQGIEEELSKYGIKPLSHLSQRDDSGWVAVDCVSVIAHIFYEPMRDLYSLESLWSDAKKVKVAKSSR